MLNRTKIAIHSLCLIAIGILICNPIAIFSASFQLSFAAVFAILIYLQAQNDELIIDFSRKGKLLRSGKGIINISIIAFCATMFFIATHFGYISIYAILANILSSVLMTVLIMPSLILYYFGFTILNISIFDKLNTFSIGLLNSIAEYFANFEHSSIYISQEYSFVLLIASLSIIFIITFNIGRKYLISLAILTFIFTIPINFNLKPNIISIKNSQAIAIIQNNSMIIIGELSKRDKNKILDFYRLKQIDNNLPKACDISGCIYTAHNKKILQLNEGFSRSNEDINLTDYIVE